jgi:hypothetical protein
MALTQKYLLLKGLDAGVSVNVDEPFFAALPYILSHWPYEIVDNTAREMFAHVEKVKERYRLSSPFIEKPGSYRDPLNVICAIVAELAWARLREDPSLLCLHGAAAEFSNRLVVFPATKKAGKSTLSVALAAAGVRMFTDDFLPLAISDEGIIEGLSSGVSPRLRLPCPAQIGPRAMRYLEEQETLTNRQYTYVVPRPSESTAYNEAAPIGGLVFLNRQDGMKAALSEISTAQALKTLIYQNFSRAGNAADILKMLEFLAQNLPCYMLHYDEAEPAIEELKARFREWDAPLPHYTPRAVLSNEAESGLKPFTRYTEVSAGQFEHAEGVHVVSTDGQRFLTGRNGQSIHYLNEGAALIWQILNEPTSVDEAVEILLAAFPEQNPEQVQGDVLRCFVDFGKNGLLQKLDTGAFEAPRQAEAVHGPG